MSETVGAALRAAREQRKLSLAQVSESTRVRVHYLQALENDDISAMPSAAQARGFLRLYADFLGLDLETLIPPAAIASPEPVTEAPADEPTAENTSSRLRGFINDLRRRLAPRRDGKPTSELETSAAASESEAMSRASSAEAAQPIAPAADKKKHNR